MKSPDVADGVAALVSWPVDGIGRAGTAHLVRKSGVRLESMAKRKMKNELFKWESSNLLLCYPLS